MAEIDHLEMQLKETFQSMKQEGMVGDHFTFIYSLKNSVEDHFYLDVIPEFCSDSRDSIRSLTELLNDAVLNFDEMKEHMYKVKGSSLSIGATRLAAAFTTLEGAIESASKEECQNALNQIQREFTALEARLHTCLQLERRIVQLASSEKNPESPQNPQE